MSGRTREKVAARVEKQLHDGAVILLHDRLPEADRLVEMIIEDVRSKGMTLERADRLLEIDRA